MHTQEVVPVAEGGRWRDRRPVGYSATPAVVFDSTGREIATFRSPRKLGKAIVSSALVLLAGDTIVVGKAPWWCHDAVLLQRLRHGNRRDV